MAYYSPLFVSRRFKDFFHSITQMFLSGTKISKSCPETGRAKALLLAPKRVEVEGGKRQGTEVYQEGKNVIISALAFSNQHTEDRKSVV